MPGTIVVNDDRCKGCGICVEFCPKNVLQLSERINIMGYHPVELISEDAPCTGCGTCALMCPDWVITVFRETKKKKEAVAGKS